MNLREEYTMGIIRLLFDLQAGNAHIVYTDATDEESVHPAVIAFTGQAISEFRGRAITHQTVEQMKLKIKEAMDTCLQDAKVHFLGRGLNWCVVFEGTVKRDLSGTPTPVFDGTTIGAEGVRCRVHVEPTISLPGVTLIGDAPQELSDLVTDYFHKKYRNDPGADKAKQKVMDSGRFVEKYLDYMYEHWETSLHNDRYRSCT